MASKVFFYSFLFCLFFIAVPTALAVVYDYFCWHRKLRSRYSEKFGQYIGQTLRVTAQNPERGSILENNLSLSDVYVERGIVSYSFKIGDAVKILPYPFFKPFSQQRSSFELMMRGP